MISVVFLPTDSKSKFDEQVVMYKIFTRCLVLYFLLPGFVYAGTMAGSIKNVWYVRMDCSTTQLHVIKRIINRE